MKLREILLLSATLSLMVYCSYTNVQHQRDLEYMTRDLNNTMLIVQQQQKKIDDLTLENKTLRKELDSIVAIGDCKITHYCTDPNCKICGGGGKTASGTQVREGVVAVDPKVIPLGSTVYIDGKQYVAEDTGGWIKGNKVDIVVAGGHQEALSRGTYYREVYIKKKEVN